MSHASLVLILISALFQSLWNAGLKRTPDVQAGAVVLSAFACGFALLAGSPQLGTVFSWPALPFTVGAGVLAGLALAASARSFELIGVALSYTIARAGGVFLLWPAAILLTGEPFTLLGLAGAAILTAALSAMTLGNQALQLNRAVGWAVLAAVCIAGYSVLYKLAISAGANPFALLGVSDVFRVLIAFALISGARRQRCRDAWRTHGGYLALLALISFAGFSIYLYALQFAGAAQLSTLRNLSILFTALFACYLGEKLRKRDFVLILIALAGTVLMTIRA